MASDVGAVQRMFDELFAASEPFGREDIAQLEVLARETGQQPLDFTQPFNRNISDGEWFWVISNGWYGMPPFADQLSEEGRWHVINYLRTLVAE